MKLFQCSQMSAVDCPGFSSIQQSWKDHSSVNQDLGLSPQVSVIKDSCPEFGIGSAGTAKAMFNFTVYISFGGENAAKVGEMINVFQSGVIHFDNWLL